jgi:hypothetical protein
MQPAGAVEVELAVLEHHGHPARPQRSLSGIDRATKGYYLGT